MEIKPILKKTWPHIAIIAAFVVVSLVYFWPVVQGKQPNQPDNTHAIGAAHELVEYEKETGEKSQWTNSMFGGMPAYQIKGDASKNIFRTFNHFTHVGLPYSTAAIVFLYMLGFYVLMLTLKMNRWLAAIGSIAFAFGSYNIIIIVAGHITKAYAIALMPTVLAGIMMIFRGQRLAGGALTTVALGMQIAYNHVQITYYLALAVMVLLIAKFIVAIREKTLADFGKNVAVLAVSTVLSVLPGTTNLWTTYEYGEYSIRGASELTRHGDEAKNTGLDKDYALSWSYGIHETPTLLIPNAVGGESKAIGYDLKSVGKLDPQLREYVATATSSYWGGRAFTSGPVYLGAVVCFLFFIGCFYYKGKEKWWLIAATIFSIMLAWGKNFPLLTDFMFYHFPFYNKFRTVEMALVIASVTVPLLGMLGLKQIYETPDEIRNSMGKFFGAVGITAGFALLMSFAPSLFYSFMSPAEEAQFAQAMAQDSSGVYAMLRDAIIEARKELTSTDAMRSAVFVVLASSALWFYSVGRINAKVAMGALLILTAIDLISVDRRYLNDSDFVAPQGNSGDFAMSAADQAILADAEPHRVAPLYIDPFNEVNTAYFHHSIGGYHGAKLRRYQDIIDNYIRGEWEMLVGALQKKDYEAIDGLLASSTAMNMLNTKYLIYNPQAKPLYNRHAQGAAWFVDNVKQAADADEAIDMLRNNDLRKTAIVEGTDVSSQPDSTSAIEQTSYAPDKITYKSTSSADQVAVFSEIYYPAGWRAFIDGNEAEIFRADYVLRALKVPAGQHEIEFRFEPKSYEVGNIVSTIGSVIVVLLLLAAIFFSVKQGMAKKEEPEA